MILIDRRLVLQFVVTIFSVSFLYIFFKPSGSKLACRSKKKSDKTSQYSKECFQQQCVKAATENECNKYARCNWSTTKKECSPKEVQCDDIDVITCSRSSDCSLRDGKCTWNDKLLQSGPRPKIINETSGLNKHCLKRGGEFRVKNLNEYVEDESFENCKKNGDISDCQYQARVKLECNHLLGKSYDETRQACRTLDFTAKEVKSIPSVPPHDHTGNEGFSAQETGSRKISNLFVMRDEVILRYYFVAMVVFIVILTNVGFANWIWSR